MEIAWKDSLVNPGKPLIVVYQFLIVLISGRAFENIFLMYKYADGE